MRITFSIIIVAFALGISGYLLSIVPYHFYSLALNEGIDSEFLKINKVNGPYVKAGEYKFDGVKGIYNDDQKNWKLFHFHHFKIPLPIRHPYFLVVPDLRTGHDPPELGARMLTPHSKILRASFHTKKSAKFILPLEGSKIFNLPAFRNYILKKKQKEIWKDLFKKDISLKEFSIFNFNILKEASYKELVYNLFILNMRTKIFPKEAIRIGYFSKRRIGIVETHEEVDSIIKDNYKVEHIYFLKEGVIHKVSLKTKSFELVSESFRQRFINKVEFTGSNTEDSIPIYNEYKKLTYRQRLDQEGMIYLFSAWTHDLENENFLREMIQFLERGKKNIVHLQPLYDYAYRKYGSNYSRDGELLKETAQKRLERKTTEELQKEMDKERKRNLQDIEGDFSTDEDQIKYFLQKAKDTGSNLDDGDNVLRE